MVTKPGEANFFPNVPSYPDMGTFQPVYGKFDLTTYIQGASDYEIMAFLVGKYNACLEAYGTVTKLSSDTVTACKQLQDWINSWFDNLDVQQELNNKIDSMVADGSFGSLLHKTFDTQINQQTTSAVTAWLVANVTPTGSAVVVDKSLSIEGAAADAKVCGYLGYNVRPVSGTKPASINDITDAGTYFYDESEMPDIGFTIYKYNQIVHLPAATATGYPDGRQILISTSTNTALAPLIYTRVKFAGNWLGWTSLKHNTYQVHGTNTGNPKPASINDITDAGTYFYDESEMPNIGFTIYKYNQIIHLPAATASGYPDGRQILISTSTNTTLAPLIYTRVKSAGNWLGWTSLNSNASSTHLPKIAFIGDSFTDANTGVKSYVDFLNEMGVCNGTNMGHSGATSHSWYTGHANDITSDYDCFFIALGLNGSNRGAISDDYDADTFCGGMNGIINKILQVNPKARVILWCMDAWLETPRITLTKQLADKWGCEYFSMKSDAKIPLRINGKLDSVMDGLQSTVVSAKNAAYQVSGDNAHPNENAQKLLAMYLKTIL